MKALHLFVAASVLALALPAMAKRDRALLDGALNESLKDKDQVQRSYKKNDSARRPKTEKVSEENRRIKLDVGDEFGSTGGGGGDYEESGMTFRRSGGDDDVKVDVEKEMSEISEAARKEAARTPTAAEGKPKAPTTKAGPAPAAPAVNTQNAAPAPAPSPSASPTASPAASPAAEKR